MIIMTETANNHGRMLGYEAGIIELKTNGGFSDRTPFLPGSSEYTGYQEYKQLMEGKRDEQNTL